MLAIRARRGWFRIKEQWLRSFAKDTYECKFVLLSTQITVSVLTIPLKLILDTEGVNSFDNFV